MSNGVRAGRASRRNMTDDEYEPSVPQPWYDRAVQLGGKLLDPVTGEPSIQGIARVSGLNAMTVRKILQRGYGSRGAPAAVVEKFADALNVPVASVTKFLGVGWGAEEKWKRPDAADYLSERDGQLVTQLIMRLTVEARQGRVTGDIDELHTDDADVEPKVTKKPKAVKVARRGVTSAAGGTRKRS